MSKGKSRGRKNRVLVPASLVQVVTMVLAGARLVLELLEK